MNKTFYKLLGIAFVVVFTGYAFVSSIKLFKTGTFNAIINGCTVLGLWFFICLIPPLFVLGKLNGLLSRVKKINGDEPSEEKYNPDDYKLKTVLPWFFILFAVSVGVIVYASTLVFKMTGSGFVRCLATATDYGYEYYDLSEVRHIAEDSASWGGVSFKGGKVLIFYELANPENVIFPSNVIMLFVCGWFFLMTSFIFLSCLSKKRYADIVPIFGGLMFVGLSIGVQAGIALAGGMNLLQTLLSGATAYIMNVFLALGTYTLLFGLYKTFRIKRLPSDEN